MSTKNIKSIRVERKALDEYAGLPYERISLTTGKGEKERVPYSSGLNWGQRPNRNQDQAYLAVPSDVQQSGFFPKPGQTFTMITVDGYVWECARRQANGKAIHTVESNSILGIYFREKLGLCSGDLVTIHHLLRYGRTSVDIYRKNQNEYILDFEVYK